MGQTSFKMKSENIWKMWIVDSYKLSVEIIKIDILSGYSVHFSYTLCNWLIMAIFNLNTFAKNI